MRQLKFGDAFKYPFRRWVGLLNILWLLIPIVGWFALIGYKVRILNEFVRGKYNKLPKISLWSDFVLGVKMFFKAIPFAICYGIILAVLYLINPIFGEVMNILISLFILPILGLNFVKKQKVASLFEVDKVKSVFNNLGDYVVALIKEIVLGIIFFIMIIIIVGIPAGFFTKNIFMAEFYKKFVR